MFSIRFGYIGRFYLDLLAKAAQPREELIADIHICDHHKMTESLKVDKTHVLVSGQMKAEGDASMVDRINENGFVDFLNK